VLSYSTGNRRGHDAAGAGPGLIWVAALQRALFRNHVPSYSGLTLPVAEDWEVFKLRLVRRGEAKAKVLLAIVTKAFYESAACLQEVNLAAEYGIRVIPLRFDPEEYLPKPHDQWAHAKGHDDTEVMVLRAQRALGNNTIPPRGVFTDNISENVRELFRALREEVQVFPSDDNDSDGFDAETGTSSEE